MQVFNYKIMKIVSILFAILILMVLCFPIIYSDVIKYPAPQTSEEITDRQQREQPAEESLSYNEPQDEDINKEGETFPDIKEEDKPKFLYESEE